MARRASSEESPFALPDTEGGAKAQKVASASGFLFPSLEKLPLRLSFCDVAPMSRWHKLLSVDPQLQQTLKEGGGGASVQVGRSDYAGLMTLKQVALQQTACSSRLFLGQTSAEAEAEALAAAAKVEQLSKQHDKFALRVFAASVEEKKASRVFSKRL